MTGPRKRRCRFAGRATVAPPQPGPGCSTLQPTGGSLSCFRYRCGLFLSTLAGLRQARSSLWSNQRKSARNVPRRGPASHSAAQPGPPSRLTALPARDSRTSRLHALIGAFAEPMRERAGDPGWANYFRVIASLANSGYPIRALVADEFNSMAIDFIDRLHDLFPPPTNRHPPCVPAPGRCHDA
ncbi:hypothetical protein [Mycobacterium sp. 1165196.3]|uniref:hypothetical protein n=1 Tax=Mycobacterium sp. 1165196.3 TaxID=1834071 RepID=UPI003514DD17